MQAPIVLPPLIISRRSLRHPGTGAQGLANQAYLLAARGLARILGRHAIVRSIYLRRSAAAGEVQLGRSDIDLTIVLRDGYASTEGVQQLDALNRVVCRLRALFPWLGQCEVHAEDELAAWAELESFRVALEASNGVMLWGEPVAFPQHPIDRRQAAYRTVFWFEKYVPMALRSRHSRNLGKFSAEMWMTASLVVGRAQHPLLTRAETLAAWRASGSPLPPPAAGQSPGAFWRAFTAMAAEVQTALLPPVASPQRLVAHPLILPPTLTRRTLLVGSATQLAAELDRMPADALAMTPEVLALYLEFMNPALHAQLPHALLSLGVPAPSATAWQNALQRWTCPVLARNPGFGRRGVGGGPQTIRYAEQLSRTLVAGRPSVAIEHEPAGPPPPLRSYFLDDYPTVYGLARAARQRLASTARRSAAVW